MGKSKKVTCVISGKSTIASGLYLETKIAEYGDEKTLDEQYICREVKTLLKKGYKIDDIRKLLNVEPAVPLPSTDILNQIQLKFTTNKTVSLADSLSAIASFTFDRSDPEVEAFIIKHIKV
jgi:hypothetical protein